MPISPAERTSPPISLAELLSATAGRMIGELDPGTEFRWIERNSREVVPGDLFIAVKGEVHDGHRFVGDELNHVVDVVPPDDLRPLLLVNKFGHVAGAREAVECDGGVAGYEVEHARVVHAEPDVGRIEVLSCPHCRVVGAHVHDVGHGRRRECQQGRHD